MDLTNLFVYGTLIGTDRLERLCSSHINILGINPAMVRGKLVIGENFPILFKNGTGLKQRAPYVAYGALVSCEIDKHGLSELDAYEGCSMSRLGHNSSSDLYHRELIDVRRIHFDNIKDFVKMNIKVEDEKDSVKAWAYIGNMKHDYIKQRCLRQHNRAGVVWKTFLTEFDK